MENNNEVLRDTNVCDVRHDGGVPDLRKNQHIDKA